MGVLNNIRKKLRKGTMLCVLFCMTGCMPLWVFAGPGTERLSDTLGFKLSSVSPYPYYAIELIPGVSQYGQYAKAGLLYDAETDKVVWEKNMYTAFPIASVTKMMVAYMAVEDIKTGFYSWDTPVEVTDECRKAGGSMVFLRKGEVFTLGQLLSYALVVSGNDACYLIAQFLGKGTEQDFVCRMNQKAQMLGMNSSFFSNSTGMPMPNPADDNRSSPSDLLILAKEFLKHPEMLEITSKPEEVIVRGYKKQVFRTHNKLTADYPGEIDGLKTGWTLNAGCCIVASARRCGHRLISIVLGARNSSIRGKVVSDMVNNYYNYLGQGYLGQQEEGVPTPLLAGDTGMVSPSTTAQTIHVVKPGDNLTALGRQYSCTPGDIKCWNMLSSNTISVGQQLLIRPGTNDTNRVNAAVTQPAPAVSSTIHHAGLQGKPHKFLYHTVQPGDTLWNIAKRYEGISVEKLKKINGINNHRILKPGTKLKIIIG